MLATAAIASEKLHVKIELREGVASYKNLGEGDLDFSNSATDLIGIRIGSTMKILFTVAINSIQTGSYEITPEFYENGKRTEKDATTKFEVKDAAPYEFTWGKWINGQLKQFRLTFNH